MKKITKSSKAMKKEQQPRGIRNNNPLNIIHTKDNWLGLRNPQYDKRTMCGIGIQRHAVTKG